MFEYSKLTKVTAVAVRAMSTCWQPTQPRRTCSTASAPSENLSQPAEWRPMS